MPPLLCAYVRWEHGPINITHLLLQGRENHTPVYMGPVLLPPEEQRILILNAEEAMKRLAERIDIFEKTFIKMNDMTGEISSLQSRLDQLTEEVRNFQKDILALSTRESQIIATHDTLCDRIDALGQDYLDLSQKFTNLFSSLAPLEEKINLQRQEIKTQFLQIEKNISVLQKKASGLPDASTIAGEFEKSRREVQQLAAGQEDLITTLRSIGDDLESRRRDYLDLVGKVEDLSAQAGKVDEISQALARIEENFPEKLVGNERELGTIREIVSSLPDASTIAEEFEKSRGEVQQLAAGQEDLIATLRSLSEDLESRRRDYLDLTRKVEDLSVRMARIEDLSRSAACIREELPEQLTGIKSQFAVIHRNIKDVSSTTTSLAYVVIMLFVIGMLSMFLFTVFL